MEGHRRPVLRLFATAPTSKATARGDYVRRVTEIARWSEEAGCEGILVYTDNGLVDPWLVAQLILQGTESIKPLVAVQPAYMHPYAAAKMVASLGHLHGRPLFLNLVAGGFRNDLLQLDDPTPHDERYDRLVEYGTIIRALLTTPGAVAFAGDYYTVRNLKMTPPLPTDLQPGVMVSGSSPAGRAAARALGALAVKYPQPPDQEEPVAEDDVETGCRVGIIARDTAEEAWRIAHERFPADRRGELTHQLAMRVSDSHWHGQLSADVDVDALNPYWLTPFQNYKTFCPYLVGTYERVGEELARYLERGFTTFILDIPWSRDELRHIRRAFDRASDLVVL